MRRPVALRSLSVPYQFRRRGRRSNPYSGTWEVIEDLTGAGIPTRQNEPRLENDYKTILPRFYQFQNYWNILTTILN